MRFPFRARGIRARRLMVSANRLLVCKSGGLQALLCINNVAPSVDAFLSRPEELFVIPTAAIPTSAILAAGTSVFSIAPVTSIHNIVSPSPSRMIETFVSTVMSVGSMLFVSPAPIAPSVRSLSTVFVPH
jgi:hypothetical protein